MYILAHLDSQSKCSPLLVGSTVLLSEDQCGYSSPNSHQSSNAFFPGLIPIAYSIYCLVEIGVDMNRLRAQINLVYHTSDLHKYFRSLLLQVITANTRECKQRPMLPSLWMHSKPLPGMKQMQIVLLLIFQWSKNQCSARFSCFL